MAETTKQAKKETASPTGAISFLVFEEQKYRATNPDVEKAIQRGQHRSPYEHWHKLGRVEHFSGTRRVGSPEYEIHFDEAVYLRAFPDIAQTLDRKKPQAAFGYWMRHGLRETLAGTRVDVFGFRERGTGCWMRTLEMPGRVVTLFALPLDGAGDECQVAARNTEGAWLALERTQARRIRGADGKDWIAGTFSSKSAAAQVFVANRNGKGWSEHLIAQVPRAEQEAAPGPGAAALFEAFRGSAPFRSNPIPLLEILAPAGLEPHPGQRLYIDTLEILASSYLKFSGWAIERVEPWTSIYIVAGGESIPVDRARCFRHRRQDLFSILGTTEDDVYEAGFVGLQQLPDSEILGEAAAVIGLSANHLIWHSLKLHRVDDSPSTLIRDVLRRLPVERPGKFVPFLKGGAGKVFAGLIEKRSEAESKTSTEFVFGTMPAKPAVSIVIPLYGRIDFLKHQLAHFCQDPELRGAEIIYVLDDPKLRQSASSLAELSWALFRLPFKFVLMSSNQGYGGANNAGAKRATAENLIFLNSDVIPRDFAWSRVLTAPLADPGIGIVGARLLYHDGTIQHDGMAYKRNTRHSTSEGLVECVHPGKGVRPDALPAGQAEVPAVTGACLAIRRADFELVGGFSGSYFVGDYEDSDLCLKIRERSKRVLINRDCVLFHLERQSVPRNPESTLISIINAYIHEDRWERALSEVANT